MIEEPNMTADTRKGAQEPARRAAKGTVVTIRRGPNKGRLQGIVTLADGSRKRLPPFPRGTSLALAQDRTQAKQEQARAAGLMKPAPAVPDPSGGAAWWASYLAHRESRGLSPVTHLYRPHIAPALAGKHPRDWTREDCERLVTALDGKIDSEGNDRISWKTAANVWSLFTRACKVACSAKAGAGLRVRSDNPCVGVEGPERGEKKQKQWLYPDELLRLLACEDVPLRWRQLYALLAYTYMRPSELRVLRWEDVDLAVGTIHVCKAWDEKMGRLKPPKTAAGVRYVPIEPTLAPMLAALREAAGGQGTVVSAMPPMEDWAAKLRLHLERAGVARAELFANTETHKQITLYDLRATGITWRCLRRDYGPEIQQAAGHEKYDTTDGYIRTARVFVGRVGEPFPTLPASLLGEGDRSRELITSPQVLETVATPAGIEPALPA